MMIYICIGILVLLVLCIFNVINTAKRGWVALWAIVLPHSILPIVYAFQTHQNLIFSVIFAALLALLSLFIIIKYNFVPLPSKISKDRRLNILVGGRALLLTGLYTTLVQAIVVALFFANQARLGFDIYWLMTDMIITICVAAVFLVNGFWRITILSRRLNIIRRVVYCLIIWVPVVNIFVLLNMCKAAKIEHDHELYKINQNKWRVDSQVCNTKYPLVMLHGVGFRDLKYINYWGRIPRELIRNGATLYYGNQEAWGTIEANAEDVKNKILQIVNTTGVKKVNIIAHSKGGLDARYMISKLEMDDCVASLTTMSTPHKGSFVMDYVGKLPPKLVSFIGRRINKTFRLMGDKNPDFETASKQFYTKSAAKFNKEVKNSNKVYYQSYTTTMNRPWSDYILFFPYIIGLFSRKRSDGLVSVDAAKWGKFKGVLKTRKPRGISHGDIIDLRRHDYKGFDVREFYVKMVGELKDMGF